MPPLFACQQLASSFTPSRNAAPLLFPTVGQLLPCSSPTPPHHPRPSLSAISKSRQPPTPLPSGKPREGRVPKIPSAQSGPSSTLPPPARPGMLERRRVWYQTYYTGLILQHPPPLTTTNTPRHTPSTKPPGEGFSPPSIAPPALSYYSLTTRDPYSGLWPLAVASPEQKPEREMERSMPGRGTSLEASLPKPHGRFKFGV